MTAQLHRAHAVATAELMLKSGHAPHEALSYAFECGLRDGLALGREPTRPSGDGGVTVRDHELNSLIRDLRDMGATAEARHIEELIVSHGEDSPEVTAEIEQAREFMR